MHVPLQYAVHLSSYNSVSKWATDFFFSVVLEKLVLLNYLNFETWYVNSPQQRVCLELSPSYTEGLLPLALACDATCEKAHNAKLICFGLAVRLAPLHCEHIRCFAFENVLVSQPVWFNFSNSIWQSSEDLHLCNEGILPLECSCN